MPGALDEIGSVLHGAISSSTDAVEREDECDYEGKETSIGDQA